MTNPEQHHDRKDSPISGSFEIPITPDWFREPGEELGYVPWQHTPLDPYGITMREHQATLHDALGRLAERPPTRYSKRGLEELVQVDMLSGMVTREAQCAANFHDWEAKHPEELATMLDDPVKARLLEQALSGHGNAQSQLEFLQSAPSLRSLDLQVLSTPFGYRRQHEAAMKQEMEQALLALGATIYDEPQWLDNHPPKIVADPYRRAHSAADPRGLLLTYKRKVAEVADSAHPGGVIDVLEREAWLVLTQMESGFSQDIVLRLWRDPSCLYEDQEFAAHVEGYVMARLEQQQGVVPLSVATYATRREPWILAK